MSSSHALEVAVALALGFDGSVVELAQLTQRAENRASGVPTGIMDQFSIAGGVAGHALLMDCGALTITPVPVPAEVDVVVRRPPHLVGSAYADRVAEWRPRRSSVRCATPRRPSRRRSTIPSSANARNAVVRTSVRDFADVLRADDPKAPAI
jgi:galactokinase